MQTKGGEIVITITWNHIVIVAVIVVASLAIWNFLAPMLSPGVSLSADKQEYRAGDQVVLEGWVMEGFMKPLSSSPVIIEVRGEELIWVDQVVTDARGHFTSSFRLREDCREGTYEAFASTSVAVGMTRFVVKS